MNNTQFHQNSHKFSRKKLSKQNTQKDYSVIELREKINNTIEQRTVENDEEGKKIIIHRYSSNGINPHDKLTFEESVKAWTEDGINYYL